MHSPGTPPAPAPAPAGKPNWLQRLYQWVLHWADTPHGLTALVLIAFVESSFFIIPPDVLLIALCMGAPKKSFKFALWCAVGSVAGGAFGYYIGYAAEPLGRWIIFDLLHYGSAWDKVAELYGQNAFLAILTAAFTPIPYKVFTIAAGVFHEQVSLWTLLGASVIGRTGRFLMVAGAIYLFGPPIKRLLEKYLELFTVIFMVLLIGGFVLIKFLLR
ncbi:MAG: VTT domain-containing protein [Lacunisphaera sp.]|nr:VTT domain-containing protein [Lacunisphaera sp.]